MADEEKKYNDVPDVEEEDGNVEPTTTTPSTTTETTTPKLAMNETYLNYLKSKNEASAYQESLNTLKNQYASARQSMIAQSNLNQIAQNEQLAAQGLAKAYNQNPNSGYSESSRIALDNQLQQNFATLGQEQRSAVNELSQLMAQSKQYANAYLQQYNIENDLNSITNKLNTGESLTDNEIASYKTSTGGDVYAYLYQNAKNTLANTILNNAKNGNFDIGSLSNAQVLETLNGLSYNDIINNSAEIQKVLANDTDKTSNSYKVLEALSSGNYDSAQKQYIYGINANGYQNADQYKNYILSMVGSGMNESQIEGINKVFGISDDQYNKYLDNTRSYYQQRYNSGTITDEEKQAAAAIGINGRVRSDGNAYDKDTVGVEYTTTDDDGNETKSIRQYGVATDVVFDTNSDRTLAKGKLRDIKQWTAGRDLNININGNSYSVELAGEKYDIDGTSSNMKSKDGYLIIYDNTIYMSCGEKWVRLRSQKNDKNFDRLWNYLLENDCYDPDQEKPSAKSV